MRLRAKGKKGRGGSLTFSFSPRTQMRVMMDGGKRIEDKMEGYAAPFHSSHKFCGKLSNTVSIFISFLYIISIYN